MTNRLVDDGLRVQTQAFSIFRPDSTAGRRLRSRQNQPRLDSNGFHGQMVHQLSTGSHHET